jgi:hypothetical protein
MIRNVILKHAFSDMVLATVSIKASFEFNWRHVNYFGEMQGSFDMDVQYGMHVSERVFVNEADSTVDCLRN